MATFEQNNPRSEEASPYQHETFWPQIFLRACINRS